MEEHQDSHGDQKDNKKEVDEEEVKSQQRVCEICFKEFSSGKALGGHKSSAHSQGKGQKIKSCSKKPMKRKYNNKNHEKSGDGYDVFLDEFDDEDGDYYYSQRFIGKMGFKKRKFGFTCSYCDKDFPSEKSLFEHMRSHSDTPHTGLDPPNYNNNNFNYDDNSIFSHDGMFESEEEVEEKEAGIINQENGISSDATEAPVVDLKQRLGDLRWFKKGIRGGSSSAMVDKSDSTSYDKGIYEDSDDDISLEEHWNASNLLMHLYKSGGSKSNLEDDDAADTPTSEGMGDNGVMNQLKNEWKSKATMLQNSKDDDDDNSSDDEVVRKLDYDRKGKGKIVEKKKKKPKFNSGNKIIIRLGKSSSSSVGDAADYHVTSPPSKAAPPPPPPPAPPSLPVGRNGKGYRCSSCSKIFPTHQALGGHRSSHNKFRMNIHNTIDDEVLPPAPPAPAMEDRLSSEGKRICKLRKKEEDVQKGLDFDLNELPEEEI